MGRRLHTGWLVIALALGLVGALLLAGCGSGGEGGGGEPTAEPTSTAAGEPFKIGFNEGFTGFMATESTIAEKGILTALEMIDNQILGRPVKYIKVDNASDPVQAVDKARQLVESDKVDVMLGPIFSPAAQAVTGFLAKSTGTPQISIMGQPSDNLKTANGLAFIPSGMYTAWGYFAGKYAAEELGFKTANAIHYDDTAAHLLQAGFTKGFEEGGGKMLSINYTPMDAVDFSAYLSALPKADCMHWWVFGNGSGPFVKQYHDYGLTAPLISTMANNIVEPVLADLGDLGLGMIACDIYSPQIDSELNKAFVEKYREMWKGEYPMAQAYAGWQAVMLFAEGVKKTGGDTTPAKLIEAMSTASIDTPGGKVTMSPYKDAFVPTRDFFMLEAQKVGDRITWVPVHTYSQVLMEDIEGAHE